MQDPNNKNTVEGTDSQAESSQESVVDKQENKPREVGGRGGLDPTRYGDWEKAGRCIDF